MYLLLLILLPTTTLTTGKQTLLATVGRFNSSVLDIVAIDPTKGNVSILYQLPHLTSLSGIDVCTQIDPKRNLIHVLVSEGLSSGQPDALIGGRNLIYELSLADGHLINTFNIRSNNFGMSEIFTQWDYDFDSNTLYGLCLNQSRAILDWNYTWCSVEFDENGLGKTQHGFYVSNDDVPPGSGPCNRVPMNTHTFSTGEYWYSVGNDLFVRHVASPTGEPGKMLWKVEDEENFNAVQFAALVTGKTNEYAIVVRAPLIDHENEGMAVVKLKPGGDEEIIAELPKTLIPIGPGGVLWDYDPIGEVLYLLMKTKPNQICDTLVKVNLTQPANSGSSAFLTIPVSLKSLFDPLLYTVDEIHLVEWPPITP